MNDASTFDFLTEIHTGVQDTHQALKIICSERSLALARVRAQHSFDLSRRD